MAAVAYTSMRADADFYESERAREFRHIEEVPNLEVDEIRKIYAEKGFEGDLLDRIVETITSNKDVWVAVMMAEEHQLSPTDRGQALRSGLVVGIAAIVGSLIPLLPFLFLPVGASMVASVVLAALVLFIFGGYKARVTVGRPGKSGLELALIGTASALVGYLVGLALKLPVTP
jgi:predicted membrane protein (TIGR00267 family)